MNKKDIQSFIQILKNTYPDATCSLDFKTPFQMVVAVMLSAQCTDERVNKTTHALFERCKNIQDFADIDLKELEQIVHPCGFYKNKAKNIKLCAKQVLENFGGEVPQTMEELLTLAGIGRKSANVILLEAFKIANGIAVDTHVKRISKRLGLSTEKGIVTSAYTTLRNRSANLPIYLYYYLHSFDIAKGFYGMGAGVRQGLNWDGLKKLKIVIPTVKEQQEIVDYLEIKCAEIDKLIANETQLLSELENYKKSVIYEYVTGKKDV